MATVLKESRCFGGIVRQLTHASTATRTPMNFTVFLPPGASASTPVPVRGHAGLRNSAASPRGCRCVTLLCVCACSCHVTARCCTGCPGSRARTRTSSPRLARSVLLHSATLRLCALTQARGVPESTAKTILTTLDLVRVQLVAPPRTHDAALTVTDRCPGAGFYVNATRKPWSTNYNMYDYVTKVRWSYVSRTCTATLTRSPLAGTRSCLRCWPSMTSTQGGRRSAATPWAATVRSP